ncbi:MAG: BatA domain-containing protein [Planctomycetota bacterium]|jgi:hypothetical protein
MLTATNAILMAAFVTPALFYAGAAAISAPIIIHLLARRRFKRIRWAAMDFLMDAERKNRRRIQLEEWILLALRCLALIAIALIVARPFLQPSGLISALAGVKQTERLFVLDDSFSMGYATDERSSFDRAKIAIKRLVDSIRRESPDDTVTILRMSDVGSPVESGTYLDDAQTDQLTERLNALQVSNQSIDVGTVVDGVYDFLGQSESVVSAAVYLVSDFQEFNWLALGGASSGNTGKRGGPFDALAEWAGEDRALRIICVNVGDADAENLALTDLEIESGRPIAGATGMLKVTVGNFGEDAARDVRIEASLGQRSIGAERLDEIPAGQPSKVSVQVPFRQPGFEALRVELPEDRLAIDNQRFHVAEVASAINILIVNGEPSPDALSDETMLLATALRPEGEVFSGHEPLIIDEAELEETPLVDFHAILLANVYRVSEAAADALEAFVARGGGLGVFLGDQVDPDLYNNSLYREGKGLLPMPLGEVIRAPAEFHLVINDSLHPMTRGVARHGDPLGVGKIPFFNFYGSIWDDGALAPDESIGLPVEGESDRADKIRIIGRFDDPDSSPAIVESRFGLGKVLLVTTSVDKEWGLWPDHPAYLPMMSELVRYLARGSGAHQAFVVGEMMEIPCDPRIYEQDATVRTPAFPSEREYGISAASAVNGDGLSFQWDQTLQPGVYELALRRRDGVDEIRRIAVNTDPMESDLASCDRSIMVNVAGDVPIEYVEGLENLSEQTGEARTELWRICLVLAVLALMTEQSLAWMWGGGARRAAAGVA